MPKSSDLSNAILNQLSSEEHKKLKKLEKKDARMGEKMLKAHSAYTQYVRKTKDDDSIRARKLVDKGFEYESKAFKARDELLEYKARLKKKYKK